MMVDPRQAHTYEHRIWKVSKALDRLSILCEQHRRQMQHKDGSPDWTIPSVPAGVPSKEHIPVPSFFAWSSPLSCSSPAQDSSSLKSQNEEDSLKGNTTETSTNAITSCTITAETELVEQCDSKKFPPVISQTSDSHKLREQVVQINKKSQEDATTTAHRIVRDHSESNTSTVNTARDDPSERPPINPFYQSTYQATFQWPRRKDIERIMDQVGGKTAGGDTYYVRRPVLTADVARAVAREAAHEFLQTQEENHLSSEVIDETTPRPLTPKLEQKQPTEHVESATREEGVDHEVVVGERSETTRPSSDSDLNMTETIPVRDRPRRPLHQDKLDNATSSKERVQSKRQDKKSTAKVGRPQQRTAIPHRERNAKSKPLIKSSSRRLTSSTTYLTNPILMHARYPPQPPVFSAQTTYTSEYGRKRRI